MLVTMMKSKIHRATVTQADLHYEGSISIDKALLDAADIMVNEQVDILNITNGERFTTYAIEAPAGSKTFGLNGAAARRVQIGDRIIIITYAQMEDKKAKKYKPNVVMLNEHNELYTPAEPALR